MSSSMNPPDPYGPGDRSSGSDPSGSGQPDGSTPPVYGSSSTYGSTPPPPPYGSQGGYGSVPPAYGSQPQYGGGYGAPSPYGYPKNSLAVWSLALGLAAFFLSCGLFAGIPAIVVGHKAKAAVAEGQANNGGMATAGIVLGWIATILSVLGVVVVGILIATGAFTEYAATTGTPNQTF